MVVTKNNACYVISIVWSHKTHYLLWEDFEDRPAQFKLDKNDNICLSMSIDKLRDVSPALDLKSAKENLLIVDLDEVWPILGNTKINSMISKLDCELILNVWNILEDLGRALGLHVPPYSKSQRRVLHNVYERAFVGVDVLNFNKSYSAGVSLLSRRDRVIILRYFHKIWALIKGHKRFDVIY